MLTLHCSWEQKNKLSTFLGFQCKETLNKCTATVGRARLNRFNESLQILAILTSRSSVSVHVSHSLKSHSAHGGMNPSASGLIGSWLLSIAATRFQNPLIHSRMCRLYDETQPITKTIMMTLTFQISTASPSKHYPSTDNLSSFQSWWIGRKQQILVLNPKRCTEAYYPRCCRTGYCTRQNIVKLWLGTFQANRQQSGVSKVLGSRLPLQPFLLFRNPVPIDLATQQDCKCMLLLLLLLLQQLLLPM